MVSKQVLMKNYQNKRHLIGIISVGRHLSAILNTCKYPAIKYTHFCIKTKMIKKLCHFIFLMVIDQRIKFMNGISS